VNLAQATITYSGISFAGGGSEASVDVTLLGGSHGNSFAVQGMPQALHLFTGTDGDRIDVGTTANTLDGLFGFLDTFTHDQDILNINDQGSNTGHTYTMDLGSVQRAGTLEVSYINTLG